jgi:hypothetical protein
VHHKYRRHPSELRHWIGGYRKSNFLMDRFGLLTKKIKIESVCP